MDLVLQSLGLEKQMRPATSPCTSHRRRQIIHPAGHRCISHSFCSPLAEADEMNISEDGCFQSTADAKGNPARGSLVAALGASAVLVQAAASPVSFKETSTGLPAVLTLG